MRLHLPIHLNFYIPGNRGKAFVMGGKPKLSPLLQVGGSIVQPVDCILGRVGVCQEMNAVDLGCNVGVG
jgi:hypothetical protein